MKTSVTSKIIYNMIITALFIALVLVGTLVQIPTGISSVHLGNFVGLLASLLCGPLVGGIASSLGMGFYDLFIKAYGPDTFIRTFIVKFLMAFIVGLVFRLILKRKPNKVNWMYIPFISIFTLSFISFLVLYILHGKALPIVLGEKTYTVKNSIFLITSLGLMSLFYIVIMIFSNKVEKIQQYVLFSTSLGVFLNIILEFFLKIPLKMLFANMSFDAAFIYATTSLPSALLTGVITTIFMGLIFLPVYYATKKINRLNTINNDIQEITSLNIKKSPKTGDQN